eukprot:CFRG1703T1
MNVVKKFLKDNCGELMRMNKREQLGQFLNFCMVVASALMIWKGLIVYTGSESPIVVVLSGSMEPAVQRGDLLFLTNYADEKFDIGDIIVYKVRGRDIPIVHRVLKLHESRKTGKTKMLTKGDDNNVADRGLYAYGQLWVEPQDVVGRARLWVPYVGMITIVMNDFPQIKYVLLAVLGFYVLVSRE